MPRYSTCGIRMVQDPDKNEPDYANTLNQDSNMRIRDQNILYIKFYCDSEYRGPWLL